MKPQRFILVAALAVAPLWTVSATQSTALQQGHVTEERQDTPLPPDLHARYEQLVRAFRSGNVDDIQTICLPNAITITTHVRWGDNSEYGIDINIPFARDRFASEILDVSIEPDGAYLLRTSSSYLFFVETKQHGWKLYRYGDKPIE